MFRNLAPLADSRLADEGRGQCIRVDAIIHKCVVLLRKHEA